MSTITVYYGDIFIFSASVRLHWFAQIFNKLVLCIGVVCPWLGEQICFDVVPDLGHASQCRLINNDLNAPSSEECPRKGIFGYFTLYYDI